jgi:hypothetical protein
MKKTLLSLATLVTAGLLSMAADCSGSNITKCAADTDCADGQICDIADGETEGACVNAECTENQDCALAGSSSEALCPINRGGTNCAETVSGCAEGAVEVVDSLGTRYCGVEPDASIDFACSDIPNGAEARVEAAAGGTVTICVDSNATCDAGQCG